MTLITGTSIKSDGSIRQWNAVEYIKERYSRKLNATMYIVHEAGEERQINMDTFTGVVLNEYNVTHYKNGKQTSKEWYHSPFIGEECTACHETLTEENALYTVPMCKNHTCIKCGDTITDKNSGWSYMCCDKPECKQYAETMSW
jgi:hypothetical protein